MQTRSMNDFSESIPFLINGLWSWAIEKITNGLIVTYIFASI
jgi:hypothetical protein